MKKRFSYFLLCAGLLSTAALTALTLPAEAEKRTISIRLLNGQVVTVTIDLAPGTPLTDILGLGGTPVPPGTPSGPAPDPVAPSETAPQPGAGAEQEPGVGQPGRAPKGGGGPDRDPAAGSGGENAKGTGGARAKKLRPKPTPGRNPDGSPTASNPGFMDAFPGPSFATGVPNFVIRKFRVPVFLLPIYQAAGIQYGVRWEILAAINEIETDYGRNLNVSSAGALGWMQFIPSSWRAYGVDANKDGKKDPYNPVDAIFAAARYLKAAGYEKDVRRAVFAYNHADWYVDSVMLRARLISGVPADLVGSLTGLTEGRFPVAARAQYADDLNEQEATRRVKRGENAANVITSEDGRRSVDIFAKQGAPVVATNDGKIKKIGSSPGLGRFVVLQDVYGNRFTYSRLGAVAKYHPVPKEDAEDPGRASRAATEDADAAPSSPASAGRQPEDADDSRPVSEDGGDDDGGPSLPKKERLFAHPNLPGARAAGGAEQLLDAKLRGAGGAEIYKNYFSRPFGADPEDVRIRKLKVGSKVIGGTVLGRIGDDKAGKASHVEFEIRPAGKGAPRIDPKPILDGWKLLEATAIYRASGKNVLYGDDGSDGFSIGQILLLPKALLERRVLADERVHIYPCGRDDIKSGGVDRRVLATLEYLAESGLSPTFTSLRCGHGLLTSSGNVSEHTSGSAVDIAKINGVPILGHHEPGGVTDTAVRRLMRLQGTLAPHQIISLLEIGGPTVAMADHADHIHVGYRPLFGLNKKLGRQALAVLKPGQWSDLLKRLRKVENPVVPTKPSKYAIPVTNHKRASPAHQGD
ncbi:MAG: lytic murein transglycosylase [Thermoleophilaceae bacterium]